MKKLTFGTPEELVPSMFCKKFSYSEKEINYDVSRITSVKTKRGFKIELPLKGDENVYGLGLQLKTINHKFRKLTLRVNADPISAAGDSHAPVPFFVTNKGYGVYIDTARYAEFYCGFKKITKINNQNPDREKADVMTSTQDLYKLRQTGTETVMAVEIPACSGVDIYIIEGETITDIVSQYNMLAGGGCDVPDWGLGVLYRCYSKHTSDEVKAMADYFRGKDIPCDILGLEPGWQSQAYSCSYIWDKGRFPDPAKTVKYLRDNGFHVNLWEHAFTHPTSPVYMDMADGLSGNYEVWGGVVPDFALPKTRAKFAAYQKKTLVDIGVDGFKLDECDSSDFTGSWSFPNCAEFPSGLDGEQYHSLFGTLYMQAIMESLGDTKTLSEVRNAGALAASYPFALYSDLYEHRDFIRGVVSSGFSGLLWSPELRHADSKKDLVRRMQTVVFSCQCLINAWYCEKAPWLAFDCEDEVRDLLKLRQTLVPMLSASFAEYKKSGKPPLRALVMDYTSDKETYNIDDQYIFCDLIVAPLTAAQNSRRVYLPDGEWKDYFTGEKAKSGWFSVERAEDEIGDIPVYVKCAPSNG